MGRRSDLALSRDVIARAALAILDEEGRAALTVRNLAAWLGVQSPSLYNHVSSKAEILDAVTEIIGEGIDTASLDDPDWRRGMTRFARSYREAFRSHPDALALIARREVETGPALALYDAALGALLRAGWSPAQALELLAAIEYLVLGSALVPFTGGFVRRPEQYADRYPALASALAGASPVDGLDDAAFEQGLAALLGAEPTGR
jgi:AcrR family transcriptional regulator